MVNDSDQFGIGVSDPKVEDGPGVGQGGTDLRAHRGTPIQWANGLSGEPPLSSSETDRDFCGFQVDGSEADPLGSVVISGWRPDQSNLIWTRRLH